MKVSVPGGSLSTCLTQHSVDNGQIDNQNTSLLSITFGNHAFILYISLFLDTMAKA